MKTPELLAPAGNLEKLRAALDYGASAVYLGGPGLNLRAAKAHLDWPAVETAVALAHGAGARVYYALNALVGQRALAGVEAQMEKLAAIAVDGLIVADPGVLALARRRLPDMPLHLSTQAATMNAQSLAFWKDQGVTRANLARELGAAELRAVAQANGQGPELEVFVHGAMCLAVSGQCLLSAWLHHRSGNRGDCCHPCRFDYRPLPDPLAGGMPVEEALRPGAATWEVLEEAEFSQMFAPADLCLVKYLPWFVRLGFAALKIEGRMKSPLYVAQVTDVYATALADLAAGRFRPDLYLAELARGATRPLGSGFFLGPRRRRTFFAGRPALAAPLAATVLEVVEPGHLRILAKGRFSCADDLEIMLPGLRRPPLPAGCYALESEDGRRLEELHPGTHAVLRADGPAAPLLRPGVFMRRAGERAP